MGALISDLDRKFAQLHEDLRELVEAITPDLMYRRPHASVLSGGEQILRSAAAVEQTFGGITANLWDDPFEWTLPETLSTPEKVADYLREVEVTRKLGFELFQNDQDLEKGIMAPAGTTRLQALLLDTLARARHYLVSARATFEMLRAEGKEQSTTQ